MNHRILIPVLTACAVCMSPLRAALVEIDNFSTVSTGTPLSSVSGWSLSAGTDTATVTNAGTDAYASLVSNTTYMLSLTGDKIVTAADGRSGFSLSLTLADSTDAYRGFTLLLSESGGVNALAFQFYGGDTNGSGDNIIKITNGTGASWGNLSFVTLANSNWVLGHAYTISVQFTLSDEGIGQDVTGTFSVYDETLGSYLIQSVTIAGVGTTGGSFDKLDMVQIKCGSGTTTAGWNSSDYMLGSIPEPATMGMLLGACCLVVVMGRRLCRR
jgi:hypothetical protein